MPRLIVCLTFDFDTQSGFIARGMTTPTPLSRGEFGALASRRILDFLASRSIKTTWFIPGFTIESWPHECEAVVKAGHEVAHHSWAHIPPATQTRDEEEADLVRANEAIARLTGKKARGYRSPSRFHRDEREDLEQVGHHHVAERADRLVEAHALAQAERLGHVDLHVVDEIAVPDRLEQAVR